MVLVTIPAASPLLAVGAPRLFLQLIQLLLRQLSNSRSLSHQPMFFAVAPDMLPCEISIRQRPLHPGVAPILITISIVRCIRRCPDGSWSWCVSIADFKFSATSFQGNSRAFSNSLIKNFSLGVRRCNDFALLDSILCQNDTLVSHWSLANPDSMAPSLIQIVCWHGSVLVHHSFLRMATDTCKPFQKHAKVRFSRRSSTETSSSSMQRDESARPTECCHLTVYRRRLSSVNHIDQQTPLIT